MFTLATTACVLRGPRFCAQGEEQVEGGSAVCVYTLYILFQKHTCFDPVVAFSYTIRSRS